MKGSVAALVPSKFWAKPTYDLHKMQRLICRSDNFDAAVAFKAAEQSSLIDMTQVLRGNHKQEGQSNLNMWP